MSSAQVRRNGPYAPLGANYADDDAIATLDLDEDDRTELLFLRGLAYCARDPRTEGRISDVALATGKVLRRQRTRKSTDSVKNSAERLVELGLWSRDGDGYRVHAWLKWNKSWEEITLKRGKDAARKGADSDTTDDGDATESARKTNGVAAPRHVTARHGSTRHGSSTPPAGAERTDSGDGRGLELILQDHQTQHGPLPTVTIDAFGPIIIDALTDGATDQHILTALTEWRGRLRPKPGLLRNLIADARQADHATTAANADVQAWIDEQQAKRAAAGAR